MIRSKTTHVHSYHAKNKIIFTLARLESESNVALASGYLHSQGVKKENIKSDDFVNSEKKWLHWDENVKIYMCERKRCALLNIKGQNHLLNVL